MRWVLEAALTWSLVAALSGSASAQERRRPAVEAIGGWAGFVDDATIDEALVAGGVRWYVTSRVSVGPEVTYMIGPRTIRDLLITGNVVFDLVAPRAGTTPRAVTPYVVAGAGLFRHSQKFGTETFRSNEGGLTGGGGARIRVNNRVYVAPELRLGWELHARAAATLGLRF